MTWLKTRSAREQYLIGAATALIILLGIWQFIVTPIYQYKVDALREKVTAQRDLSIVTRYDEQLRNSSTRVDRQPFNRSVLVQIAADENIPLSRIEPTNDGSIEVQFENSSGPRILSLLNSLEENYLLTISRLQITRRQGAVVSASVVLTPSMVMR